VPKAREAGAIDLRLASSDADIAACHAVMSQLRPHVSAEEFPSRVRRQMAQGYQLLAGWVEGRVVAVAGFRLVEMLAWGRSLYVDDLVTDSAERSKGYGESLMRWLIDYARARGCEELHLDSGVQRFDAHRFYLAQRMKISSHHFAIDLRAPPRAT
jgi:GNAT superfamily N-acetyltransferase